MLVDRRARRFLGMDAAATEAEINGVKVKIVGSFALGPDFVSDGTVIMSDRTFASLLRGPASPPAVDVGVIKAASRRGSNGRSAGVEKGAARDDRGVHKAGTHRDSSANFQAAVSSAGPIFAMGTIVGFVVGMLISYQVTYTDLADQLPQYATLKAIGYRTGYLFARGVRAGGVQRPGRLDPGMAVEHLALSASSVRSALLPLHMSLGIAFVSLGLTLGMCLISAAIAVGRVIKADPAEVF